MLNLANLLEHTARLIPDKPAAIDADGAVTYGELSAWSNRIASGLIANGYGPGDRIGLVCPTSRQFLACYFGIMKAGCTCVPLNILLAEKNIADNFNFVGVKACICLESSAGLNLGEATVAATAQVPTCRQVWVIPTDDRIAYDGRVQRIGALESNGTASFEPAMMATDAPALINFTSGTTGAPKAAELSHGSDFINLEPWTRTMGIRREDIVAGAAGFFMGFGRSVLMNPALRVGATLVLRPKFEAADMYDTIARHKATIFVGVPAMFHSLWYLHENTDRKLTHLTGHLRSGAYGGAPMVEWLRKSYSEQLGIRLYQAYGMTEAGIIGQTPETGSTSKDDVLAPMWGVELRVVDEAMRPVGLGETGEVVLRGGSLMNGYVNNEGDNAKVFRHGWLHTGDVARVHEGGRFCLIDRMVETINRGGYKVYPAEIERWLMEHPQIDRASVKGVPDPRLGHDIAAWISLKPGAECTPKDIQAWAKSRMPKYAYPRLIAMVDELPTGPTGKVIKAKLPDIAARV